MAVSFNFTGEYAIDQGADWYATFIYKQPAEITNITGNGTTVTVTAVNGFTPGQTVSIDGVTPPIYNLQNVLHFRRARNIGSQPHRRNSCVATAIPPIFA
jgi:hypothetical protein